MNRVFTNPLSSRRLGGPKALRDIFTGKSDHLVVSKFWDGQGAGRIALSGKFDFLSLRLKGGRKDLRIQPERDFDIADGQDVFDDFVRADSARQSAPMKFNFATTVDGVGVEKMQDEAIFAGLMGEGYPRGGRKGF